MPEVIIYLSQSGTTLLIIKITLFGGGWTQNKERQTHEGSVTCITVRSVTVLTLPQMPLHQSRDTRGLPELGSLSRVAPNRPPLQPLSFPFSLFKASGPPLPQRSSLVREIIMHWSPLIKFPSFPIFSPQV